jgi:hypothetical protein
MQSNAGECRRVQSAPRDCRNAQRKTEQSKRLQRCTDSSRRFPRRYRECSNGKEEFCLPTKLHAPSLADRVIGHVGCVLNAFGLFARHGTDFGVDNSIATFMILVWVISNTGSPCG